MSQEVDKPNRPQNGLGLVDVSRRQLRSRRVRDLTELLSGVDKTHAVALVLEGSWDRKGLPAQVLALVFGSRRTNARSDSDAYRA